MGGSRHDRFLREAAPVCWYLWRIREFCQISLSLTGFFQVNENLRHDKLVKERCFLNYPKEAKMEAQRVSKEYHAQLLLEYENRQAKEREETARAALLKIKAKDEEGEYQEAGKNSPVVEEVDIKEELGETHQEEDKDSKLSPEEEEEIRLFQKVKERDRDAFPNYSGTPHRRDRLSADFRRCCRHPHRYLRFSVFIYYIYRYYPILL